MLLDRATEQLDLVGVGSMGGYNTRSEGLVVLEIGQPGIVVQHGPGVVEFPERDLRTRRQSDGLGGGF